MNNSNGKMKILILCTGNSCRSQMAEAFLKSFDKTLEVYSAGTEPADLFNPHTIKVMSEIGIDISQNQPKSVNQFIGENFDYVITVCDHAKEICPVFFSNVKQRLHLDFEDPAEATGTETEILAVFRRVRDEIKTHFSDFYNKNLRNKE